MLSPPDAAVATGSSTAITRRAAALILASVVVGIAYPPVEARVSGATVIAAKGLCVGLLTLAALALASPQRKWLAAIMAAGTAGDVLLEIPGGFLFGAGAFAVGHVIAIIFYRRNRRDASDVRTMLVGFALIGWGLAMPGLVSPPGTPIGALMLYSVLLCGMAAALLGSRFTGPAVVGALLFVFSDTLLIMRLGGRIVGDAALHGSLVWLSYSIGQALILVGVARQLGGPIESGQNTA